MFSFYTGEELAQHTLDMGIHTRQGAFVIWTHKVLFMFLTALHRLFEKVTFPNEDVMLSRKVPLSATDIDSQYTEQHTFVKIKFKKYKKFNKKNRAEVKAKFQWLFGPISIRNSTLKYSFIPKMVKVDTLGENILQMFIKLGHYLAEYSYSINGDN